MYSELFLQKLKIIHTTKDSYGVKRQYRYKKYMYCNLTFKNKMQQEK
jgi:hypothetical protein